MFLGSRVECHEFVFYSLGNLGSSLSPFFLRYNGVGFFFPPRHSPRFFVEGGQIFFAKKCPPRVFVEGLRPSTCFAGGSATLHGFSWRVLDPPRFFSARRAAKNDVCSTFLRYNSHGRCNIVFFCHMFFFYLVFLAVSRLSEAFFVEGLQPSTIFWRASGPPRLFVEGKCPPRFFVEGSQPSTTSRRESGGKKKPTPL